MSWAAKYNNSVARVSSVEEVDSSAMDPELTFHNSNATSFGKRSGRSLPILVEQIESRCPSAPADASNAVVLGVVLGTAFEPRLTLLADPIAANSDILALAGEALPTEVFRFAAPCAAHRCRHFRNEKCQLAERIVATLPEVVSGLPSCRIRPTCRWWQQEGREACVRCPQIVTYQDNPDERIRAAACANDEIAER
jgi:hypothetical protein